jgi:hypothetical protein
MGTGSILEGAFRLVRERPGAVAVWWLIYLALTILMTFAMQPLMAGIAQASTGISSPLQMFGQIMLINLLNVLVYIILMTAAQRAVLRPQDNMLAYVRIGMDELRMLALTIILVVGAYIAFILLSIVVMLLAAAMATAGSGPATLMSFLFLFGVVGLFIWLEVRLSLAFPLTLLRRKIIIGESWRLTKGRFWSLFLAYLVIFLIFLVLVIVVGMITAGSYFGEIIRNMNDPQAMERAMQGQVGQMTSLNLQNLIGWTLNAATSALWVALGGGAVATAVRGLVHDHEAIAETFA